MFRLNTLNNLTFYIFLNIYIYIYLCANEHFPDYGFVMVVLFRFLVFLFLLPLVQTYFFNLAIGHDPKGLNIAVVNKELEERRPGLCKPEYYSGCFLDYPEDVIMSCAYVDLMKTRSLKVVSIL